MVYRFMNKTYPAALVAWCLLCAASVEAADDMVKKFGQSVVRCTITSMSKDDVKYEKGSKTESVPTYEIEWIRFADEPAQLVLTRNQVNNGAYENALTGLGKIDTDSLDKPAVKSEIQFLRAFAHARLALGGSGDISDAGRELKAFIDANPDSYHYYAASELAGDLLVAMGKYDAATVFYKALQNASADAYKIKAGIDTGRAKLAEKKYDEALTEFDRALTLAEKNGPENQKLSAMLGKASCLAKTGKPEEGVKLTQDVIGKLSPEEADLHAWAYVVLGNCYRQMPEHTKDALYAFLYVDLLYFSNPQHHAEALWNLASLWSDLKKIDRATQAASTLKERYPNSTWAKL